MNRPRQSLGAGTRQTARVERADVIGDDGYVSVEVIVHFTKRYLLRPETRPIDPYAEGDAD